MSVKVGPMAAAFDGEIAIETQKENWTGVVSGKGADARAGSRVTGSVTYRLGVGSSEATRIAIASNFNLAGPLAQFGKAPILQEIAKSITADFVRNFEARLSAAQALCFCAARGTAIARCRRSALDCACRAIPRVLS
jgi:uncharacterized protein